MTCAVCGKPRTNSSADPHGQFGHHEYQEAPVVDDLTIHNCEQRSEEWDDLRRGIVTASAVGQLITVRRLSAIDHDCPECGAVADNPCLSKRSGGAIKTLHPERAEYARNQPSSTVLEVASNDDSRRLTEVLVAERITGYTHPTFIGPDMWRGIDHEPIAREYYARYRDTEVTETGILIRDDGTMRIGYSPDGMVGTDGLLEVKCPRQHVHMRTFNSDAVPPEYMPQLQAALLVSGRKWIDFVSFVGGMKLFVKRVYPIPDWQAVITQAARRFEANAREMQRIYDEASAHMPDTERIPEETLELKL